MMEHALRMLNLFKDGDNEISHVNTGAAIGVKGELVLTPEMKQPFEIRVEEFELIGQVDASYPLLTIIEIDWSVALSLTDE